LKKGRASIGVVVKGIDSEKEKNVTSLENSLRKKDTSLLGDKKIFIGSELSKNLAISPDSNVVLISPTGDSLVPGIIPKMENYKVADIFESGMYEYDSNMVYIRIEDANDLFAGNAIRGKGIKIKDVFAADDAAEDLRNKLGPGFTVKSWNDMNKNLFSALKLEKFVMFLILTLIVIVATFNVISLLAVTTVEKIHSVGILKAIGAGPASITRIFLCLGSIIGILGSSLGMFFGLVICYLLQKYKFISLPADIYYINKLPVKIFVADVVVIMTVAFLVTLISSVYPAWKAGRIEPCEAIRYE